MVSSWADRVKNSPPVTKDSTKVGVGPLTSTENVPANSKTDPRLDAGDSVKGQGIL